MKQSHDQNLLTDMHYCGERCSECAHVHRFYMRAHPALDGSVARYVNIFYRNQTFTHMLP